MTKFYTLSIFALSLASGFTAKAQVGINTTEPDASSVLDIVSTEKGLLIPRLTMSQRNNISSPANGLLIYQTDNMPGFYYYKGSTWQQLSGGSGSGSFVDLTTDQTVGGKKTFSSEIIAQGIKVGLGSGNNNAQNTSVGIGALDRNTDGYFNTAYGFQTLGNNTTGGLYTVNGTYAQANNTTGYYNTSNGGFALYQNTTGGENTAIGIFALQLNNGDKNTALGSFALESNSTGYSNTAVGSDADVIGGTLNNATAIRYNAKVDASNKVRIGDTFITAIEGQVPFTNASDSRFKTNIKPMDKGLDFIMQLKPVSYQMKDSTDKRINWGFVAQDVENLVGTQNAVLTVGQDSLRSLGLRYTDFISPLVKAIQELAGSNTKLAEENTLLKQQIQTLKQQETDFAARLLKVENLLNIHK